MKKLIFFLVLMVSFGMAFVSCSDALEQEEIVVGRECSGTTLAVNLWNSFRNGVTRSSEKEFLLIMGECIWIKEDYLCLSLMITNL
jgi:hypothetical protein